MQTYDVVFDAVGKSSFRPLPLAAPPPRLLRSGAFRPVIDRSYPLEQIVEGYRYVATGQKIGNVLVTV